MKSIFKKKKRLKWLIDLTTKKISLVFREMKMEMKYYFTLSILRQNKIFDNKFL